MKDEVMTIRQEKNNNDKMTNSGIYQASVRVITLHKGRVSIGG